MERYINQLLGPLFDWNSINLSEDAGIKSVGYDQTGEVLVLECRVDNRPFSRPVEGIRLDLTYVPHFRPQGGVDISNQQVEVEFEIPQEIMIESSVPMGSQIFAVDHRNRYFYGEMTEISDWGRNNTKIVFPGEIIAAYTESGDTGSFDSKNVKEIGIKFRFPKDGEVPIVCLIVIRSIAITPGLLSSPLPDLPKSIPFSFLRGTSLIEKTEKGFVAKNGKLSKRWFITGGNWVPIKYRQNFGTTGWYPYGNGVSRHPGFVDYQLQLFRRAGVTLLRVFLLDDGSTMMDQDGNVVGYNDIFKKDVQVFLDLALKNDIKVEFTLLDFVTAGMGEVISNVFIRGRSKVFEDEKILQLFIINFLRPFLREYGKHPALFGFDIVNEPEWMISWQEGGRWTYQPSDKDFPGRPVALSYFRKFVSECICEIRKLAPEKFITLGVSCPNTGLLEGFDLDYAAVHYYKWMGDLGLNLSRLKGLNGWNLEEFPGKDTLHHYFRHVYKRKGWGAMLWNLSPGLDVESYTFEDEHQKLKDIRRWVDHNPLLRFIKYFLLFMAFLERGLTFRKFP